MMTLTLMMTNEEEHIDPSVRHSSSCGHKDRAKQKRHEHRHTHAMYRKIIDIVHTQKNQRKRKFFWGDRPKKFSGYLEEGEGGGVHPPSILRILKQPCPPPPRTPPPPQKGFPGTGGGGRGVKIKKIHRGIIFSPKMMFLQGVRHPVPYLRVSYANDPKKAGICVRTCA